MALPSLRLAAALVTALLALAAFGMTQLAARGTAAAPGTDRADRGWTAAPGLRSHPRAVEPEAGLADVEGFEEETVPEDPEPEGRGSATRKASSGAPSDAEIRDELQQFRQLLRSPGAAGALPEGERARVRSDGTAVAPRDAPDVVKEVIRAGNMIAKTPYLWGGGHGGWEDTGYDCSGSVSFALAGAGLLHSPMTSGGFTTWGDPGPGEWITIYANAGHIFMFVAGLRFDTSGRSAQGTRWQAATRSTAGFTVVHPPGL